MRKPDSVRFQPPPGDNNRRKPRPRRNRSRPAAADQPRVAGPQNRWRVDGAPWGRDQLPPLKSVQRALDEGDDPEGKTTVAATADAETL
eukprot:5142370-Alexandrium_andersonii.AAC.1